MSTTFTMATATAMVAAALLTASPTHGLPPTPVRRQVLPPVPGYIPVYIQHGDVPPEDTVELADLFRVAGDNLPPADVESEALYGAPTVTSPDSSTSGSGSGSNSVSNDTGGQSTTDLQDDKQASTGDVASERVPIISEPEIPAAAIPGLSQGEADNAIGDPAMQPEEKNPEIQEIINLEPFPDKVEIGADKLTEMIDASKMDAEESQSNNAEQTSPAPEMPSDPEIPTTEEATATK